MRVLVPSGMIAVRVETNESQQVEDHLTLVKALCSTCMEQQKIEGNHFSEISNPMARIECPWYNRSSSPK